MAYRNDHEAALARVDALEVELARARREANASRADAGAAAARIAELEKRAAEMPAKPALPHTTPAAPAFTTSAASVPSRRKVREISLVIHLVVFIVLVAALVEFSRAHPHHRYETRNPTAGEIDRWAQQKHVEDCRLCQDLVSQGQLAADSCGCP
ncbi:MAG TPA: hypothetical protein VGM90_14400 [Kofleriaceae bacterium]|jgi:hypothetical protein